MKIRSPQTTGVELPPSGRATLQRTFFVALHSTGDTRHALDLLRAAHDRRPGDRNVLLALATISRDAGALDDARAYADALVAVAPWDPSARQLREDLNGK